MSAGAALRAARRGGAVPVDAQHGGVVAKVAPSGREDVRGELSDNLPGVSLRVLLEYRRDVHRDRVAFQEAIRHEKQAITGFKVDPICPVLDVDDSKCRVGGNVQGFRAPLAQQER